MKHLEGYEVYQEDALVIRWKRTERAPLLCPYTYSQGKRLSRAKLNLYPWAQKMARIYVKDGTIEAIKFVREQTGCGLQEALNKVRFLRDKE
jgi:hypothetical protein